MSVQIVKSEALITSNELSIFPEGTGSYELDKAIEIAGYALDQKQDIFYSIMEAWQREVGYCRLYDILAAPFGMIIDSEPIYFEYHNKKWMIGLWKGQYDYVTGAEIGIYTKAADLNFLGLSGAYYNCASNDELLRMSYILKKNGETLFTRKEKHWWLTGFKLGEFSEPRELTMDITITLQNISMREAFVTGLWNAGYTLDEFTINGATVSFTFDRPHTPQPFTRIPATDRIIQRKNEILCNKFLELTGESATIRDKVKTIQESAPDLYTKMIRTGNIKELYKMFSTRLNLAN
jgi:hypothetical protein